MTSFLFSISTFSAAGVVGPFAPSAITYRMNTRELNFKCKKAIRKLLQFCLLHQTLFFSRLFSSFSGTFGGIRKHFYHTFGNNLLRSEISHIFLINNTAVRLTYLRFNFVSIFYGNLFLIGGWDQYVTLSF